MERRKALSILGATAIAAPLLRSNVALPDSHLLNPEDKNDLYIIHRKLRYSMGSEVVYWYLRAVRYGLFDSKFTPFWDMHVGFITIVEDENDGFSAKTMSSIFYTDLKTGKLLESFNNPFTGKRVPVRQPGLRRSNTNYNKVGRKNARPSRPAMTMTQWGDIGPAWIVGDDIWIRGDTGFRAEPTTANGNLAHVNDWSTFHGSLAEVSNPAVLSANSTEAFNDVNTWPSWLEMSDQPGNYVSRGFGRKSWSMEGMPKEWSAIMKDQYPKEFSDPRTFIEGS